MACFVGNRSGVAQPIPQGVALIDSPLLADEATSVIRITAPKGSPGVRATPRNTVLVAAVASRFSVAANGWL